MNKLFENFPKSSKEDWINQLTKELKGADFDATLIKTDEIEEITFPSFNHSSDSNVSDEAPGNQTYKRGFFKELNDWSIVGIVEVNDEKTANQKALDLLMKGNSALLFEFGESESLDLNILFQNIKFEYIKVYLETDNIVLIEQLNAYFSDNKFDEIFLNYNPLKLEEPLISSNLFENRTGILRSFNVDAYSIQQTGANCSQEIAFALSLGHRYLFQQIQLGRSIDDALMYIHFTFGVGSNYLFEIAKLRAFRMLWFKIANSYSPEHKCSETVQISSKIGFTNKSLKDPYTNLLRQTTEVMSAVLGGANHIINQAYDKKSTSGSSELAERMATNISLILKEESYLDKVLDAVGGSYAIEELTEKLADKSWGIFQEIDAVESLSNSKFFEQIKNTAQKRVNIYKEKTKTLIGVNKFSNPDLIELQWKEDSTKYFTLSNLIIEESID